MHFSRVRYLFMGAFVGIVAIGTAQAYNLCIAKAASIQHQSSTDQELDGYIRYTPVSGPYDDNRVDIDYVHVCAATAGTPGTMVRDLTYGASGKNTYCWVKIVSPFASWRWVNFSYGSQPHWSAERNCYAACGAEGIDVNLLNKMLGTLEASSY